jgi:hypothetical protein
MIAHQVTATTAICNRLVAAYLIKAAVQASDIGGAEVGFCTAVQA